MIDYNVLALFNLSPNCEFAWTGTEWEGLEWLDSRPCPTKEEWETEKARLIAQQPLSDCKVQAQALLSESDWADLVSVRSNLQNVSEWDNYRSAVRQLRTNPVQNPVFPDKPQALWKTQTQDSNSGGNT